MIRNPTNSDDAALLALILQAAFPPAHVVSDDDARLPHVQRWLGEAPAPNVTLVHQTRGGEVVGDVWARIVEPPLVEEGAVPEVAIAVDPARRGSGIGTALMLALHARCREHGIDRLALAVSPRNPALRLYQRIGYHVADERDGRLIMTMDIAGHLRET